MTRNKKVIAVLPAYNAATTLEKTYNAIPKEYIDEVLLVDDASRDDTVSIAESLGIMTIRHKFNKGYGGNQKTCYKAALASRADIVIMIHPDHQYDPVLVPSLLEPILKERADAVFGSRMIKGGALEGGMPLWKYTGNKLLTAIENVVLCTYLTEYHSGFRAYSRKYLESVQFDSNSNGFVFDTEIVIQGLIHNMRIEEVPITTRYFKGASTIGFWASCIYGFGILQALSKFILFKYFDIPFKQFE